MMDDLDHDRSTDTDPRLVEALHALRAPIDADAAQFDARVLAQLRTPHRGHGRKAAWLAVAALAASFVIGASMRDRLHGDPRGARHATQLSTSSRAPQIVHFRLAGVQATSVAIAGSFNGWNPDATPLHRAPDGTWAADVALAPGRHVYQFVIDDAHWIPDPRSPREPGDDFGTSNSVLTVLPRRTGS